MNKTRVTSRVLTIVLLCAFPAAAVAQSGGDEASSNVTSSLKALHELTVGNILKTAEMLDEELYAYRPTEDVRTVGQLIGHVANAQYMFCSIAGDKENPSTVNIEETVTAKADLVAALKEASAFCAGIYDGMTDAAGAEIKSVFGREMAASAILAFNSTHNYEHYGNLVTYMRMNGIVPPSSM